MSINQKYKQCMVFNKFNISIIITISDKIINLNEKFNSLSKYVKHQISYDEINKQSIDKKYVHYSNISTQNWMMSKL